MSAHACSREQPAPAEGALVFPVGMVGFGHIHRYALIVPPQNISVPRYLFLDSLDPGGPCFILLEEDQGQPLIQPEDRQEALECVGVEEADARFLLVATPRRAGDHMHLFLNLKAPVILDVRAMQGWQYIFPGSGYPLQYDMGPQEVRVV